MLTVDVQAACAGPDLPPDNVIHKWVAAALEAGGPAPAHATEVTVRIVSADEIQRLNREYRDQDKATNVLTFPAPTEFLPDDEAGLLGDVVVCAAVVQEEAIEQRKRLQDHWAHILLHGTLHLLGYDHEEDAEAAEMEALEVRVLGDHGIANPYASG